MLMDVHVASELGDAATVSSAGKPSATQPDIMIAATIANRRMRVRRIVLPDYFAIYCGISSQV